MSDSGESKDTDEYLVEEMHLVDLDRGLVKCAGSKEQEARCGTCEEACCLAFILPLLDD